MKRFIKLYSDDIIDLKGLLEEEKNRYNSGVSSIFYPYIESFKLVKSDDKLVAWPLDKEGHKIPNKKLRYNNFFSEYLDEIVKDSDNVEDLFDGYALENEINTDGPYTYMDKEQFELFRKAIVEVLPITKQKCYGAIWTDWGFKFVAELNQKGEWKIL